VQTAQQTAHAIALDDAAAVDDGDVAAQCLGLLQVVRGEDDGGAACIDIAQEVPHRATDLDIDAGCRLIQDQQPRLVHERPGDHQPALHAAGERARHAIALVPQLQLLQVFLRAHSRYGTRNAVEPRLVHHDGERALEHVEVDFLRHDADTGLGRLQLAVDVVPEHAGSAGALVDERGDDADERGLARAVGAEQREEIAALDVQIDAAQRLHAVAVGLGESADRERIHEREDRVWRSPVQERAPQAPGGPPRGGLRHASSGVLTARRPRPPSTQKAQRRAVRELRCWMEGS